MATCAPACQRDRVTHPGYVAPLILISSAWVAENATDENLLGSCDPTDQLYSSALRFVVYVDRHARPAVSRYPSTIRGRVLKASDYVLSTTTALHFSRDTSTNRDTAFTRIEARVMGSELAEKFIGAHES